MTVSIRILAFAILLLVTAGVADAQSRAASEIKPPQNYRALSTMPSDKLRDLLSAAITAETTIHKFKPDEVAATLIDLSSEEPDSASYRGDQLIYPASVVKLFYMAALIRQIEDDRIKPTPELERGLHDMIVDSSNDATGYIFDVLTGTSSGPELSQAQFTGWQYKRNRVNRWFALMGYTNINVNQKTFCEDAYGVEQQTRKYRGENRNMLTTDAVARMLAEIVLGRIAGTDGTAKMMSLLARDPFGAGSPGDQAHGFTGKMFIDRGLKDARIWSKAGWTSETRHDAAYIETANGQKFVLVIFTVGHANDNEFIPAVAGRVLDALAKR